MRRLDDVAVMEDLDPVECRRLMATQGIGRVGVRRGRRAAVLPVTFALIGEVVVFRTALGSTFDMLVRDAEVAFEVDQSDPAYHSGWSVVGRGTARGLEEQLELEVLERLPLRPWGLQVAPGWIGIALREVRVAASSRYHRSSPGDSVRGLRLLDDGVPDPLGDGVDVVADARQPPVRLATAHDLAQVGHLDQRRHRGPVRVLEAALALDRGVGLSVASPSPPSHSNASAS